MAERRLLPPQQPRLQPDISLFIVNIVLLLILFFLATGQIMNGAPVEQRLAITQDLPLDLLPEPLLQIAPNGALLLNAEPITDAELADATDGFTDLFVLIDGSVDASRLLDVMARDELSDLNIELVTIANRPANTGGQ